MSEGPYALGIDFGTERLDAPLPGWAEQES